VSARPAIDVVAVFDDTILAVKRCAHHPRVARALASPILDDRRVLPFLAASLVAHLAIVALLVLAPSDGGAIDIELGAIEATSTSSELALPLPVASGADDSPDRETPGAGGGMHLATRDRGHIRIARHDESRRVSREAAVAEARDAGLLGATALAQPDAFRALIGSASPSSGFDDASGLYGGQGESTGSFGYGRSGFGPGCDDGCSGWGVIGVGRYGTISSGRSAGGGFGAAGGAGGMSDREARAPTVIMCGYRPTGGSCAVSDHGIDKAIIRRYVRRHLDEIRYCYEKELLATPGLAGTVATEFMINPDGSVADARATGMSDAVDACVAKVIVNIAFPGAQTHIATTIVHYPFELRTP